jgi:nicotinamide mononucleotide transporter
VIDELSVQLASAWHSTGWVEIIAAVLAVVYLLLAIKQRQSCWVAAFVSSCLYVWVLFGARLYMESMLNAFYAAMAVYGYRQWTRRKGSQDDNQGGSQIGSEGGSREGDYGDDQEGGQGNRQGDSQGGDYGDDQGDRGHRYGEGQGDGHGSHQRLGISRWSVPRNAIGLLAVICLSIVSSFFLRRFTPAAWPFVDSMVTWASVFATFLVARKVYENWHWWLIIDSVSLCLYFTRRLYLTVLLFGLYLLMIVIGMREWRRDLQPAVRVAQLT